MRPSWPTSRSYLDWLWSMWGWVFKFNLWWRCGNAFAALSPWNRRTTNLNHHLVDACYDLETWKLWVPVLCGMGWRTWSILWQLLKSSAFCPKQLRPCLICALTLLSTRPMPWKMTISTRQPTWPCKIARMFWVISKKFWRFRAHQPTHVGWLAAKPTESFAFKQSKKNQRAQLPSKFLINKSCCRDFLLRAVCFEWVDATDQGQHLRTQYRWLIYSI